MSLAAVFLERYGKTLLQEERDHFVPLQEDYEVGFWLRATAPSPSSSQPKHVARNRRTAVMHTLEQVRPPILLQVFSSRLPSQMLQMLPSPLPLQMLQIFPSRLPLQISPSCNPVTDISKARKIYSVPLLLPVHA